MHPQVEAAIIAEVARCASRGEGTVTTSVGSSPSDEPIRHRASGAGDQNTTSARSESALRLPWSACVIRSRDCLGASFAFNVKFFARATHHRRLRGDGKRRVDTRSRHRPYHGLSIPAAVTSPPKPF
jgi:hypothetical protein